MMIRIWEQFKKLEIQKKAILWFTFANIMQKGVTIIGTPIFTRIMSKSEYGITTVYQSWLNIFTVIVTLNLSYGVFSKGLEKFEQERSLFSASIQSLSVVLGGGWIVFFLIFKRYFEIVTGLDWKLLLFMFLSFLTTPIFDLWMAKERFEYRYKKLVFLSTVNAVISIILPIIGILVFRDKILSKVVFSSIFLVFIGFFIYSKTMRKEKFRISARYWKYAIKFNLPLIPHYLSMIILNHSDRIMIQKLCGDAEAGMYSVAHQIANTLIIVTSAITASFTPFIYQNIKAKKISLVKENILKYSFLVGIMSLCIIIIAPELMRVFASPLYYEAVKCVAPLVLACFVQFSYSFFNAIQFYFEKTSFTLIVSIAGTMINIALNFILVPYFGYVVCAYTTLFTFCIMALSHFMYSNYLCKKYLRSEILKIYKSILLVIIFLLASISLMTLYNGYILRYILLVILIVLFMYRFFYSNKKE